MDTEAGPRVPLQSLKLHAEVAGIGARSFAGDILLHPDFGYMYFASVFTELELPPDEPMKENPCPAPSCVSLYRKTGQTPCMKFCPVQCLSGEIDEEGNQALMRYDMAACAEMTQQFEAVPSMIADAVQARDSVEREDALFDWATRLDLAPYVLIGRGEELTGGRTKKAILADAMEAVIGAFYLDSGAAAAQEFVLRSLRPEIARVASNTHRQDFKTLLQQLAQKRYHSHPRYRVVKREGPDHDRTFWIAVQLAGHTYGPGSGKNKKAAEQQAAARAYAALTGRPGNGAGRSGPAAG